MRRRGDFAFPQAALVVHLSTQRCVPPLPRSHIPILPPRLRCSSSKYVIHDKRTTHPGRRFTNKGIASPQTPITLSINLASNDLKGLESKLLEVSTPGSDSFRQWLSKEDVSSYVAPTHEARQAINAWLSSHGIDHVANSDHRIGSKSPYLSQKRTKCSLLRTRVIYTHPRDVC